ncbi:Nn.00g097680.m01.CDS01 [Neocucurbitaria sp. VM-36]
MSHMTTDPSQQPSDRLSWSSLPSDQDMENIKVIGPKTQTEQSLPSPSPKSRPTSRSSNHSVPVSHGPPYAGEDEGLLSAGRDQSPQRSGTSTTGQSSMPKTTTEVALEPTNHLVIDETRPLPPATWLPYTLRRPFLVSLGLVSLALSTALVVLSWCSVHYHGLGKDDRSARLLLGWRYTPTIIAVLFTQALVTVSEDVKRTEAFARMARPIPIQASYTLLYSPKVWWKSLFEGLSRKRSGGQRSWLLTFSSLTAGLSILVISTFSSSVFLGKDVITKDALQLQRYVSGQDETLALQPRRATYSRTISGFLYNTSASIWVSDSHVVLPLALGPVNGSLKSLPDGVWEAETRVIQMESECIPATMIGRTVLEANYSYAASTCEDTCTVRSRGFKFRSEDGCEVQMQSPIATDTEHDRGLAFSPTPDGYYQDGFMKNGGLSWTNMSSSYVSWQDHVRQQGGVPHLGTLGDGALKWWSRVFIYDLSDQCRGRDLLLVTPPWSLWPAPTRPDGSTDLSSQEKYWENLTVRAEVCSPTIYEAKILVTVSTSGANPYATFDPSEFARQRRPTSKDSFDNNRLDNFTFNEAWTNYMTVPGGAIVDNSPEGVYGLEGVSMLLSKAFNNTTNMLQNSSLAVEASRLRARFFYELLLSSIVEADVPAIENVTGNSIMTERRIVVVQEVAITLAVLFLFVTCYSLLTCRNASTARRPLHLRTDPATIMGTTCLIDPESSFISRLRSLHANDRDGVKDDISFRTYTLKNQTIAESMSEQGAKAGSASLGKCSKEKRGWFRPSRSKKENSSDWRPLMLHKRWLVALLVALVAVGVTILVLHKYAVEEKLYQTAFVYQVDLGLFKTSLTPHSVVATLIAVTIGLTWDGIDKPMRTLQPYLGMSQKPSGAARSISLSYQSSFWVGAAVKAAMRKHWILCLIAVGTTLSQILIISMAALFERQAVIQTRSVQEIGTYMDQSMTHRQSPFSFCCGHNWRPFFFDESLLATSQTDWLYNALDEITLGSRTPQWTRDEWVFTPVDMDSLPNASVVQDRNTVNLAASSTNVSLITSALRSRLECSTISVPSSGWLDRAEDVFSNRTREAISGYILPAMLFKDTPYSTPVFSAPRRMACCTNGTSQGSQSVVAYWSSNSSLSDERLIEYAEPVPSVEYWANDTFGFSDPYEELTPDVKASLKIPRAWSHNFTIKWIVGPSASIEINGEYPKANHISMSWGRANETLLYFTEQPKMAILNCIPVIERANASIVVARSSSQILDAKIVDTPQPATEAWEYAYDLEYTKPFTNFTEGNVSYGVFFTSQLLTAPHIVKPPIASSWLVYNQSLEDVASERFNIRDRDRGLNMDFMSYANLHKVGNDPTALLDTTLLLRHSEKTFQTFFKHFSVSGRWVDTAVRTESAVFEENDHLLVNGTISERIEILSMNETATWLSLAIIFVLVVILVVLIVSLQVVYPKDSMQHHVECLADVLAMVAGSDELLKMSREVGIEGVKRSGVQAKLGWFRDKRGAVRWGVEIADGDVEWVKRRGD